MIRYLLMSNFHKWQARCSQGEMNENLSLEAIILGLGVGGDGKKWYN